VNLTRHRFCYLSKTIHSRNGVNQSRACDAINKDLDHWIAGDDIDLEMSLNDDNIDTQSPDGIDEQQFQLNVNPFECYLDNNQIEIEAEKIMNFTSSTCDNYSNNLQIQSELEDSRGLIPCTNTTVPSNAGSIM